MDKLEFLKNFSDEEKDDVIKNYDKFKVAETREIPMFSNEFLTPNIWSVFEEKLKYSGVSVQSFGGFDDSDRRILAFNKGYSELPITFVKITNKSNFKDLLHKDYLGALMSLGIKRGKIGDVILADKAAYVSVMKDIVEYILSNLTEVGKSPVEVEEVIEIKDLPSKKFEEFIINISSNRLDNVVGKLTNNSRGKALQLIQSGSVLVNYRIVKSKSLEINDETSITIRGYGKFLVGKNIGTTKSNRNKVVVKKYI